MAPASPDHVPLVAVSTDPSCAGPATFGGATGAGAAAAADGLTGESSVIAAMAGCCASFSIWRPVSSAETPLITPNRRPIPFALPGVAPTSEPTADATPAVR